MKEDRKNDLALLQVSCDLFGHQAQPLISVGNTKLIAHYKVASIQSALPQTDSRATLAGYPLGRPYPVVLQGTVAAVAFDLPEFPSTVKILLSLVANHRNSGGPVFNDNGEVIEILESALPSVPYVKEPAIAVSGIAVAVPAYYLSQLVDSATH